MDIITWLIVGLVAGCLASVLIGGSGFGLLGDVTLGIIGALVGGWTFRELHLRSPMTGLPGVILVALAGSVLVLLALRVLRSLTGGGRRR